MKNLLFAQFGSKLGTKGIIFTRKICIFIIWAKRIRSNGLHEAQFRRESETVRVTTLSIALQRTSFSCYNIFYCQKLIFWTFSRDFFTFVNFYLSKQAYIQPYAPELTLGTSQLRFEMRLLTVTSL